MMNHQTISVVKAGVFTYPREVSAFRPGIRYPEYSGPLSPYENFVYDAVRESLHLLGMDEGAYGTPEWNPLGEWIQPGMNVLIKPNLVMDRNHNEAGGTDCLYTHPSVVAPVIDYVIKALQGTGRIVVGDAPMQSCNFLRLITESGYQEMVEEYQRQGIDIQLVDFRGTVSTTKKGVRMEESRAENSGIVIDLGKKSAFAQTDAETLRRMRVTSYDPRLLQSHHQTQRHEYEISNHILQADVIINMPKPKTHRKAGVTISLKNMVGANVHKEFLPHHTMGAISEGGDEYEKKNFIHALRSRVLDRVNICEREKRYKSARIYRRISQLCTLYLKIIGVPYSEGSWYGNRTVNRTIADINQLIYFADPQGKVQTAPCRKVLIVADMIISGEKEGPVAPSPKEVGLIAAGTNPICFDEAIATLMGMDISKIPTLSGIRQFPVGQALVPVGEVPQLVSNDPAYHRKYLNELHKPDLLDFHPTTGWSGHIEKFPTD